MVRYFKDLCDDLVNGIKSSFEQMEKDGKLKENTTFKDVAEYAGRHVILSEEKTNDLSEYAVFLPHWNIFDNDELTKKWVNIQKYSTKRLEFYDEVYEEWLKKYPD